MATKNEKYFIIDCLKLSVHDNNKKADWLVVNFIIVLKLSTVHPLPTIPGQTFLSVLPMVRYYFYLLYIYMKCK